MHKNAYSVNEMCHEATFFREKGSRQGAGGGGGVTMENNLLRDFSLSFYFCRSFLTKPKISSYIFFSLMANKSHNKISA